MLMDTMQMGRIGEALEDLRLALKYELDRGNMNLHAWRSLDEARQNVQAGFERLSQ